MKTTISRRGCEGLTFWEVIIVLAVLAAIGMFLSPWTSRPKITSKRITCVNNLNQVGLVARMLSDSDEKFPWQLETNYGGTLEWAWTKEVYRHYQAMSNELMDPKFLFCPSDSQRYPAVKFDRLSNTNVSYFLGLLVRWSAVEEVLSGDRNLALTNQLPAGVYGLTSNMNLTFSATQHKLAGNIGLMDGSVQQVANSNLSRTFFNWYLPPTNWVAVP